MLNRVAFEKIKNELTNSLSKYEDFETIQAVIVKLKKINFEKNNPKISYKALYDILVSASQKKPSINSIFNQPSGFFKYQFEAEARNALKQAIKKAESYKHTAYVTQVCISRGFPDVITAFRKS